MLNIEKPDKNHPCNGCHYWRWIGICQACNYSLYRIGYLSHLGAYSGSSNGMAKLTEDDVRFIREAYVPKAKGQKCNRKEIAEMFGVSPNLISKIVSGAVWTHV